MAVEPSGQFKIINPATANIKVLEGGYTFIENNTESCHPVKPDFVIVDGSGRPVVEGLVDDGFLAKEIKHWYGQGALSKGIEAPRFPNNYCVLINTLLEPLNFIFEAAQKQEAIGKEIDANELAYNVEKSRILESKDFEDYFCNQIIEKHCPGATASIWFYHGAIEFDGVGSKDSFGYLKNLCEHWLEATP